MPMLTVVMPARNAEQTIKRAVLSTLNDMSTDSELVVLDDGSTDGTVGVLGTIGDRRLRIIERSESVGVSSGLNYLLRTTDSRFVARMDADDITIRGRFRRQMRALETGLDVVFTSVIEWRQHSLQVRPNFPRGLSAAAFPFHLLVANPVAHPSMAALRTALSDVSGYRAVPAEDYDLWLRMCVSGHSMVRLGGWGLIYRLHPQQVTGSSDWRSRSWRSVPVLEEYEKLSEQILGARFRRLAAVVSDPNITTQQRNGLLMDFEVALKTASKSLGGIERQLLMVSFRQRKEQLSRLVVSKA